MEVNYGRGKTPTARAGQQNTDGATTGDSPGTLGAFTYKGAMGLNPDDHAEGSGICAGSRQPVYVDGHLDPHHVIKIGVMNGDSRRRYWPSMRTMRSPSIPTGWHSRTKVGRSSAETA